VATFTFSIKVERIEGEVKFHEAFFINGEQYGFLFDGVGQILVRTHPNELMGHLWQ